MELSSLGAPMADHALEQDAAVYQAFHEYLWDLDKDFLGGLVLALGGYHALAQTASQADIIMHSRLFYYAHARGITVPYAGYRQWLRTQYLAHPDTTRIWEWHLLRAICSHRDRLVAVSTPSSTTAQADDAAAAEQEWMRGLLQTGSPTACIPSSAATPAWMVAAPRGDLYVNRLTTADAGKVSTEQVPYPEQFAAIIKAVQSGKQIEGIVEVPDIVARNPTTTPFGRMARPHKPWEKRQPGPSQHPTSLQGSSILEHSIDSSFPGQEDPAGLKS